MMIIWITEDDKSLKLFKISSKTHFFFERSRSDFESIFKHKFKF